MLPSCGRACKRRKQKLQIAEAEVALVTTALKAAKKKARKALPKRVRKLAGKKAKKLARKKIAKAQAKIQKLEEALGSAQTIVESSPQ